MPPGMPRTTMRHAADAVREHLQPGHRLQDLAAAWSRPCGGCPPPRRRSRDPARRRRCACPPRRPSPSRSVVRSMSSMSRKVGSFWTRLAPSSSFGGLGRLGGRGRRRSLGRGNGRFGRHDGRSRRLGGGDGTETESGSGVGESEAGSGVGRRSRLGGRSRSARETARVVGRRSRRRLGRRRRRRLFLQRLLLRLARALLRREAKAKGKAPGRERGHCGATGVAAIRPGPAARSAAPITVASPIAAPRAWRSQSTGSSLMGSGTFNQSDAANARLSLAIPYAN